MERGFYHVPSDTNWNGVEFMYAFNTDQFVTPGKGYCADDGSGRFRVNYLDSLGNDRSGFMSSVKIYDLIKIYQVAEPTKFAILSVDFVLDQGDRYRFNFTLIHGSMSFDNNANLIISFVPSGFSGYSGRSGYSGYSGSSGISGYSGTSGYSGYSGRSGYSGYSGIPGDPGSTGASGYSGYSGSNATATDPAIALYTALGGTTKAESPFVTVYNIVATLTPTNQQMFVVAVYLSAAATITGVKWYQNTLGNYTANNYNGVGLYTYSGGTLTLVASSTNDGTIWQTFASGTFGTKAFSSTYAASAGVYFVAGLYCRSAVTTVPLLGATTATQSNVISAYDFTNSARWNPFFSAQTSMPASIAMSSAAASSVNPYLALY